MDSTYFGTWCFALALIHTFLAPSLSKWEHCVPVGPLRRAFHMAAEAELIIGFYALLYIIGLGSTNSYEEAVRYLSTRPFAEPIFVIIILVIAAQPPVLNTVHKLIELNAKIIPIPPRIALYCATLIVGPLLGSLVTEPAAMTVTALILVDDFFKKGVSPTFRYATLGLLLVNISIGGTLTPYAAPPVLMVASSWGWDLSFMMQHFGYKAILACIIATAGVAWFLRKELQQIPPSKKHKQNAIPLWVILVHLFFVALCVRYGHHIILSVGIFILFLGFVSITKTHQPPLKLKQGVMVGVFLAGLVILGEPQQWWLVPLLSGELSPSMLYWGSVVLTAFTDNAALTYLGTLVPHLADASRYALVAGSVVGGGLTVIANAPNPVAFGLLTPSFGSQGIRPLKLLFAALFPTAVAAACFLM